MTTMIAEFSSAVALVCRMMVILIVNDDDDDYRVSWCRCPGRPVRRRTKPLWKGSENVRSDQINEDRRWSWVRCNIYNISMKQDCLRRTYTFLACWTNRFLTCHFVFSLLSFLFLFFLVGERGLLHVIHLFCLFFIFTTPDQLVCCFPPLEKPGTNLRKWKCSQTSRGKKNFFVAKPVGQNHI